MLNNAGVVTHHRRIGSWPQITFTRIIGRVETDLSEQDGVDRHRSAHDYGRQSSQKDIEPFRTVGFQNSGMTQKMFSLFTNVNINFSKTIRKGIKMQLPLDAFSNPKNY
jgi:hypothetical protein